MIQDFSRLHEQQTCPRCGGRFICSASAKCWCYEVDVPSQVLELIQDEWHGCLCPACLNELAVNAEKRFC